MSPLLWSCRTSSRKISSNLLEHLYLAGGDCCWKLSTVVIISSAFIRNFCHTFSLIFMLSKYYGCMGLDTLVATLSCHQQGIETGVRPQHPSLWWIVERASYFTILNLNNFNPSTPWSRLMHIYRGSVRILRPNPF